MKQDQAENIIRQKVKRHEVQVSADSDALWDRLNVMLDEAPKRGRFPLYYAAAAVLLVIVCIAVLMRYEGGVSKKSIVINAEERDDVKPFMSQEQPQVKVAQTPLIVAEIRKIEKKHRTSRQGSSQHMPDQELLEQIGKEAEDGLYANPIASTICNAGDEIVF